MIELLLFILGACFCFWIWNYANKLYYSSFDYYISFRLKKKNTTESLEKIYSSLSEARNKAKEISLKNDVAWACAGATRKGQKGVSEFQYFYYNGKHDKKANPPFWL